MPALSRSLDAKPTPGHWVLLGAILLAAILVRVVAIGSQGLGSEEAQVILQARWPVSDMLLEPTAETPFLYYALQKMLVAPDASLAAMRSISLVFGILSVGLSYVLGRLAYGPSGGLLAAALLAVFGLHVQFSQEADPNALLVFLTLVASVGLLLYARAMEPGSGAGRLGLLLFGIGNLLAFYTHSISLAWILVSSLVLIVLAVRRRDRITEVAVLFGAMAILASPGIYRLIQQAAFGSGYDWLQQRGPVGFVRLWAEVFLPFGFRDIAGASGVGAAAWVKMAALGLFLIGLAMAAWLGRRQLRAQLRERPAVALLIVAYLLVPLLLWLYGFVALPILIGKHLLYAGPGIILLIAGVCLSLDRRKAAWAGCAAVLLYGLSLLAAGTVRPHENWNGAFAFLAQAAQAGDVVAVCPFHEFTALRHPADRPLDVPVVTRVDGNTIEIEAKLGADPHWDRVLFQSTLYPHLALKRLGRQAPEGAQGPAGTLALQPGQSVWRVDGHCGDKAEDMDRFMSAAAFDAASVRYQDDIGGPAAILIRQYRVNAPLTLEIRDATPKP